MKFLTSKSLMLDPVFVFHWKKWLRTFELVNFFFFFFFTIYSFYFKNKIIFLNITWLCYIAPNRFCLRLGGNWASRASGFTSTATRVGSFSSLGPSAARCTRCSYFFVTLITEVFGTDVLVVELLCSVAFEILVAFILVDSSINSAKRDLSKTKILSTS